MEKTEFTLKQAVDLSVLKWEIYVANGGFCNVELLGQALLNYGLSMPTIEELRKFSYCGLCWYQHLQHPNTYKWGLQMCIDCPLALKGQRCTDARSIYKNWERSAPYPILFGVTIDKFISHHENKELLLTFAKKMLEVLKQIKSELNESN